LGIVQFIYSFIEGSCSRHATFEKIANEIGTTLKTLKSLSTTRWACRAEAVAAIKTNYSAILGVFTEIIKNTEQSDIKAKRVGLLYQVQSFDFIFCLTMMHPILQLIVKVSKLLQSPDINLINAMASIKSLRSSFGSLRNTAESQNIFNEVEEHCKEQNIDISLIKKRKVSSRIDECNCLQHYYDTKEEESRVTCFFPILDTMISALDSRFQQETIDVISAMGNHKL